MDRHTLLAQARQAALRAYAPYSHFRVGAAVVVATPSGPQIITGTNVENASFGLSLCAERAALAAACGQFNGIGDEAGTLPAITHIAVACIDAPADGTSNHRVPCGACRQWFAELAPDVIFYIDGILEDVHLADLLPMPFALNE